MRLSDLPALADALPGFDLLLQTLQARGGVRADGLAGTARAFFLARLWQRAAAPMLLLTYSHDQARRLCDDFAQFGIPEEALTLLPAARSMHLENEAADPRVAGERIAALSLLASGQPCVIVAPLEGALQYTTPPSALLPRSFVLEAEQVVEPEQVAKLLAELGYVHAYTVTQPGEFSRRGGILDLFPATQTHPARLEWEGDQIESIRLFDVATQRSIARQAMVEVAPAREMRMEGMQPGLQRIQQVLQQRTALLYLEGGREAAQRLEERVERDIALLQQADFFDGMEQYLPLLLEEPCCALHYLPHNGILVLDEPRQNALHWERFYTDLMTAREKHWQRGELLLETPAFLTWEQSLQIMHRHPLLTLAMLGARAEGIHTSLHLEWQSVPADIYRGRLKGMADEIGTWLSNECRVMLTGAQPHRVREICAEMNLPLQPQNAPLSSSGALHVLEGGLRSGFKLDELRLYLLTDAELFGADRPIQTRRKVAGGTAISSVLDLREKDYVVHIHHGIGIYRGMVKRRSEGNERDYLLIEYQGGDRLFVPADQIDRLQRYHALDSNPPAVNRIGGADWQRTRRKVREQARKMAAELIQLYAARQAAQRPPFAADTPWQQEMEDAFPYEETPSQLRAIRDVKKDMEKPQPMDRLVCGDVGFGKTEVAIRAAFKAVLDGKQVAILCPTTVLAAQHHATFSQRLAPYPITVELLSRFRTRQEQLQVVQNLKAGTVDVVVATHRLLGKDVEFDKLGLVIVDEEQRFGVAHKERLKQLRTSVDVLTLSATPIPRTFSMALTGLRDMSVIEDPPEGRLPVATTVREYEDDMVRDAILRELERDGQVYFVHNRIESITHVEQHLRKLCPGLRIEIGHGQMSEDDLENVMHRFYHHEADVLLCTTIIENGLDIPNANTIIIDNADHLGLAQLYQLRGRVGRSTRQAYAYLLYRRSKLLNETAEQRLAAIKEFSALGSGHRVAMRDLEIRGAGNLLGAEQSGAMVSVGFDMYCQLLQQAVQELNGEEPVEHLLPPVDLPVTALLPDTYIPSEAERIFFYKRMSAVRNHQDIKHLQEELEDRFGDPPKPVWEALNVMRLRLKCQEVGIASIRCEGVELQIRFMPHIRLSPRAIQLLTTAFRDFRFLSDGVATPLRSSRVLAEAEERVDTLAKALQMKNR